MHWAEKIADRIIKRNPDKEEYVCAAGISPSGSIHIGNFRDIATSLFVAKAVVKKGKKGQDRVTYKITYSDGKEIARKELERETVEKPVAKVVARSTRVPVRF